MRAERNQKQAIITVQTQLMEPDPGLHGRWEEGQSGGRIESSVPDGQLGYEA